MIKVYLIKTDLKSNAEISDLAWAHVLQLASQDLHMPKESIIDLYELTLDEIIDFDAFRVICNSVAICLYGMDAVKVAEKRKKYKKKKEREGESGCPKLRTI